MAADHVGQIVIVGGGIIGCSIAYHLCELGVSSSCTLIECCSVASGASGKAGGFLARNWCANGSRPLAQASYELHQIYGKRFDCDYRPVTVLEKQISDKTKRRSSSTSDCFDSDSIDNSNVCNDENKTAQVHPKKLTQCFMKAATDNGCKLIIDQVTGVEFSPSDDKKIVGVRISKDRLIPCDTLVLAMGPWTNTASPWFDYCLPQIGAKRAHSIVVTPKGPIPAHSIFLDYESSAGSHQSLEVYPRPDGTVYLCGYDDDEPLPEKADLVKPNMNSIKNLQRMTTTISSKLENSELIAAQACYLPTPPGCDPVIGKVNGYHGQLYMAAGHSCWGILNAPATGKGLAELIVHGKSSIDLSAFNPANHN